ncbi:serine/threonine-protein kinase [Halarcobacter anaerophilus]|uniref:serine/threonine-protein kinase n=1 Tax=Halarcobacter anaerophilus TaxID=877500 RepID=UPI0005CB2F38|nr:serine/threonine-protein kinase [Halarcobacter anaerophilus]
MSLVEDITKKSIKKKFDKNEKIKFLNKKYYCLDEVGRGGLSIVYEGLDIYSEYFKKKSNIVIKTPTKELLQKDDIAAFVYAEYRFLRRLNLDSIVKVIDFGIDKKSKIPYLVLEYIQGELLSEISIANMTLKTKKHIFKSLIKTLNYIHSKNIIHADISPTNIIMNKENNPIIIDFGISQDIKENEDISLEYKKVKALNPRYCAPELLENEMKRPTIYSDIFSLGTILYEIYANKPLFEKTSKELFSLPIKKRDLSSIPFVLRNWFKNALSVKPQKRKLTKIYFF